MEDRRLKYGRKICPECGSLDWGYAEDSMNFIPSKDGSSISLDLGLETMSLFCLECGYIKFYMTDRSLEHMRNSKK